MAHLNPCVPYKDALDLTAFTKVKMEKANDAGQLIQREAPVFESKQDVEGLFYVYDQFDTIATELGFNVGEKWTQFPRVLSRVAQANWNNLIRNIAANQRTAARFQRERKRLLSKHAEHEDPRDVLLEYLRSDSCSKPRTVMVGDHVSRIEVLCDYANRLEGTEPELQANQIKKIAFDSFPRDWKSAFLLHNRLADKELDDIIEFMAKMKTTADTSERKKRKRGDEERIRGGGSDSDKKKKHKEEKKGKKTAKNGEPVCHKHPHGSHSWSECSLNPESKNYGMFGGANSRSNGGNHGGRGYGGGRGKGGRGSGGYGGGRGNGGYQRQEQHHYEQEQGQPSDQHSGTPVDQFHYHHGPRRREEGWRHERWYGGRPSGHHHPHNNNNNNNSYGFGW